MGRTLRTKLIISTLAVSMMGSALLLAMLLAGLASRSTKAVEQSLSDQVLALSHSIEAVGTLPVAQRILASANTSDIIDQLYLIEGHTKVIKAATNRAMIGMNVRDLEDKRMIPTGATGLLGKSHLQLFTGQESNQFYVAVETKIMSDDQLFEDTYYLIGHLNAASELESVKRQLWMIIVGFLVILTVSAGVYLWGILHYVVQPLSRFKESIGKRTSDGEASLVSLALDDEIGDVVKAYNDLVLNDRARRSEMAQKNAQIAASAQWSQLAEMAGGIAHEINNPLAIISGKLRSASRMLDKDTLDKSVLKSELEIARDTTERIAKIIRGMRTISRNADNDPFNFVSFTKIFDDALALCSQKFHNHGVHLKVQSIPSGEIECRHVQIVQVLLNLLNNAYDAVHELPQAWVELNCRVEETRRVVMTVTDSGSGIPPDIANKLMQPFFTTKPVGKGTGLGLSLSRRLIEDHGGKLYIDHACANTRFVVEIPLFQTKGA